MITFHTIPSTFISRMIYCSEEKVSILLISDLVVMCCRYIKRRAREEFRKSPSQPVDLGSVQSQLDLVKRQGIVYSLYSRTAKSVMVCNDTHMWLVHFVMCSSLLVTVVV